MLVPDTPQPSLELVTLLFSPKAPLRRPPPHPPMLPLQCDGSPWSTCAGRVHAGGHCQSSSALIEAAQGTEQACFEVFSSGSPGVFPLSRGSWGQRRGREGGREGQRERSAVGVMTSAPSFSAGCLMPYLSWCVCVCVGESLLMPAADVMDAS